MGEAIEIKDLDIACSLYIKGLDCPDCAAKVEKAVKMIPGVSRATLAFPLGKLNVAFDAAQTGIEEILEKVQTLGYDAQWEAGMVGTTVLPHCALPVWIVPTVQLNWKGISVHSREFKR